MTQYTIDSSAWVQITGKGRNGYCWLDFQDDGVIGSNYCLVIESVETPTDEDITRAMRVFKPSGNNEYLKLESEIYGGRFWARCKNTGDVATLSVRTLKTNNLNDIVDQGRLFFLQTRTRKSTADRIIIIRTGAKTVHFLTTVSAGLASTLDFYEGVTPTTTTELTPYNYDRVAGDSGLLARAYTGTFTGGVNISPNQVGFGSNPGQAQSGTGGEPVKYVLKPNTDYAYILNPDAETDSTSRAAFWED